MATPTKAMLIEQLRDLRVEPPVDATSQQLQDLVKRVKALPASPVKSRQEPVRAPLGSSTAPPLVPPRPLVSKPTTAPAPKVGVPAVVATIAPPPDVANVAVAPPRGPTSDHDARPWDPFAGV